VTRLGQSPDRTGGHPGGRLRRHGREFAPEIRQATPASEPLYNLKSLEAPLIRDALLRHKGHRRQVAEALGISTASLWRKMRLHAISG